VQPTVTRVLILKAHETGETSEVLHVLSAQHGRLSLYARGLRSPKNRLRGVLQPLSLVEATYVLRDGEELATLRDATEIRAAGALASDLERLSLGLMIAELAGALAEPGAPAGPLLEATLHGLESLDPAAPLRPLHAAAIALFLLLETAGTEPSIDDALLLPWPANRPRPVMFWLDLENGRLHGTLRQPAGEAAWPLSVPPDAAHFPVPPSALRLVHCLQNGTAPPPMDRHQAAQWVEALLRFAEYHLGHGLKAATFWRQLL